MEITPTEYDVIVIGTGITECIVAAACSRIGKTVLHLDINRFYGEQWSSFSLSGLEKSATEEHPCSTNNKFKYTHFLQNLSFHNILEHKAADTNLQNNANNHDSNPNNDIKISDDKTSKNKSKEVDEHWTLAMFEKSKRRINIDITPKLCYSDGPMVELLRSSNCSRYLEFKAVNRSFVHHKGQLIQAPCNREQVFNSKHLAILEKRLMMKFVTFALQVDESSEEFLEWDKKEENELYKSFKLTDNLVKLVRASLVVSNKDNLPAQDALRAIKVYLKNVGIYGSMPFICPIYGSGELPQAFARFSAVFGSVYVLDMSVTELNFNESGKFDGVTTQTGQKIGANFCVISPNYTSSEMQNQTQGLIRISHTVILSDKSIKTKVKQDEQDDVSLIHIPPGCLANKHAVSGYEYGPRSCLPAEEMYMIHLMTPASDTDDPKADLEGVTDSITEGVHVLYKVFFTTKMSDENVTREPVVKNNIVQTSYPTYNVAYKESIEEARKVFSLLLPEEDFLPAAPNPEDIKWPDDDEVVVENKDVNNNASLEDVSKSEEVPNFQEKDLDEELKNSTNTAIPTIE